MEGPPEASWLAVGRVRRPHGVHGEVAVEIVTDFPQRMVAGVEVGIGRESPDVHKTVDKVRLHRGDWLLTFVDVLDRSEVEGWHGLWLFLPPQERSTLPQNYYYEHELAGCACTRADGSPLGEVTSLQGGPGGALLAVATPRGEVLVPFVSHMVVAVDLGARTIMLDPPRGLFDDDAL
jgi:16S rRNA processing protein RimM